MNKIQISVYLERLEEIEQQLLAIIQGIKYDQELKSRKVYQARMRNQEKGVVYGRPKKELPSDFEEVCSLLTTRQINFTTACERLQMKKSTFYKYYNEWLERK